MKTKEALKTEVISILNEFKQEMEGYSYYGSNPGVSVDDFEDITEKIVELFNQGGEGV